MVDMVDMDMVVVDMVVVVVSKYKVQVRFNRREGARYYTWCGGVAVFCVLGWPYVGVTILYLYLVAARSELVTSTRARAPGPLGTVNLGGVIFGRKSGSVFSV